MYTVIGNPNTKALRVYWALEELSLKYDFIPAEPHSTWAKATNLSGRVPSLRTEDGVLLQTCSYIKFLSDRHGNDTTLCSFPIGSYERAQQDGLHNLL